jgi:hypothetical protein
MVDNLAGVLVSTGALSPLVSFQARHKDSPVSPLITELCTYLIQRGR